MNHLVEWWGEFSFSTGQIKGWRIGERIIAVEREQTEWQIWNLEKDAEGPFSLIIEDYSDSSALEESLYGRFLLKQTSDSVFVRPALADRPVVARPASPIQLLGGESTCLYVSTPLWFQVKHTDTAKAFLDIPFFRPSDSWFGPSTREGELCYAKYTDARLDLAAIERRCHRAITPINVNNHHADPLLIERINVPVPMLSLMSDKNGMLWTDEVTVTREHDEDTAELNLQKGPPARVGEVTLVAGSRELPEKRTLIRSISSLFA